ncbi:MAG: hypothetical protein K2O15_15320, partial [Lachnospiraceae bacterium]|nr:hypothetical protein [Lachnospiraceae bacterium]
MEYIEMNIQDNVQKGQNFLEQLKKAGVNINLTNVGKRTGFEKLELTAEQKVHINGLLQYMPEVVAAGKMAEAYTVKFPKGLPHTLMVLKQGGFGSPIIENGKIVGMASFTPMLAQAAVMGAFTVLSIATSQFFLAQINKELHKINRKLDEILAFLYGDKQAELLAELNFLQYACDNYAPIMECGDQRIATLVSMQAAKKVAKK